MSTRPGQFHVKAWSKARRNLRSRQTDLEELREHIESQLEDKAARRKRYYDQFERGRLTPSTFEERIDQLSTEIHALTSEITLIEVELERTVAEFPAEAIDWAQMQLSSTETTDAQAKNVLRTLIKNVSIGGKNDIVVTYRLPVTVDGEAVRTTTPGVEAAGIEPASADAPV